MSQPAAFDRPLPPARAPFALLAFRLLVIAAVIAVVDVAAALGHARHAGWVAAELGLPLGLAAAAAVRRLPAALRDPAAPAHPAAPVRLALLLPAACVLFLITLLPLLATPLPPFDDYLNHLARIHLIALGDAPSPLHTFYAIHWRPLPNLAMDIVVPPLARVIGTFAAGKVFLICSRLMLLTGPFAIHRALYRDWSLGPLAAALFVENYIMKMGVVNYVFGVGLALFGIAAWIALRERHAVLRGLVSCVFVLALFFAHLVALGVYGLAIGGYELSLLLARPAERRRLPVIAATLILPVLPIVPLLAIGWGGERALTPFGWGGVHARLDGLRMLVESYAPRLDLVFLLGLAAGLLWAMRRRAVSLPASGWAFLAVAGAVFLVIPNWAQDSWGAAARLPTGIVLVLCGMLRWDLPSPRARGTFLAILTALLLLRTGTAEAGYLRYDRVRRDMAAALEFVPPGSRILVAEDYAGEDDTMQAVRELPCLAMITRASLVSLEYSDPVQQVLIVRPPFRAATGGFSDDPIPLDDLLHPPAHDAAPRALARDPSGRIYWRDWPKTYDYVVVLNRREGGSPDPVRLRWLYGAGRVQLFQVRPG